MDSILNVILSSLSTLSSELPGKPKPQTLPSTKTQIFSRVKIQDIKKCGDFPGSPVIKTLPSRAGGVGLIFVWGTRRRELHLPPKFEGFPCGSARKESTFNAGDLASTPGLGRSLGEGKGSPLQYPGLENPMDCLVYGVAELDTTE